MAMRPMLIFPSCCSALADLGLPQITLQYVTTEQVALRAPNKKRFWDAVVVDGVYGETFGQ